MISGWWVAALLLVILIVQTIAYRRLKNQLQQETTKIVGLESKLSVVQTKLDEVQARRKKSLAASTEALITVEGDYTISSANKVARQLFGKPNKGVTLMAWTRQHQLQELVDRVLQDEKVPPLYFNLNDRKLETHARAIRNDKKSVTAVALAIQDVTELQRLSRARRDFVANISHELRTPLASIQLLTETLLDGALKNKNRAFKLVNKIAVQVDTLSQLAQELRDLSLIESGQAPLKMAPYSLKSIAKSQIESLLPQAERKKIALKLDIDKGIKVLVDEAMIGRVIANLLHNAIKFTETGSVTISARRSDEVTIEVPEDIEDQIIVVSISDTGIGIPPDELPRIFERFYKVDPVRSSKQSGTGLGLAIAKHIIEAHGGRIWAESSGQGTTFYFTLLTE